MEINQALLFFFSALGAFNGFLFALYFIFVAKPKMASNRFLGLFLLSLSIRIGKSVFFYFNTDLSYIYLQLGLTGCVFIGPFLYFYMRSVLKEEDKSHGNWKIHLMLLIPLTIYVNVAYPFEHHIDLWRPTIIHGIYYIWLGYTLLAAYEMRDVFGKIFDRSRKMDRLDVWLISIIIGNTMIWAAYYFAGVMSYILGALLFSFMLYLLILYLVLNRNKDFVQSKSKERYQDKKIEENKAKQWLANLTEIMESEKLYKNSNLKMGDVAKKLKVPPHLLSQLLNDNLGKGFPQFLNEYRIEEAKSLIQEKPNLSLEHIGYECGFNSKSTFYATFKKLTATTPAVFQKSFKNGSFKS